MYVFKLRSGELREAPPDFDPACPDPTRLAEITEVLHVDKIYTPQIKLVLLPKAERDAIRKRLAAQADAPATLKSSAKRGG